MRLGGSPLSAWAHLTSEFILLSWAFTSPGYNSLQAGISPPLSSRGRVPDPAAALKKPMKTNDVAWRVAQVQESGACLRQPSDYQRELSKHLQALASEFLYFDRLNLFSWG